MPAARPSVSVAAAHPGRRAQSTSARARAAGKGRARAVAAHRRLGGYLDGDGRRREVVARRGSGGSMLVLDRDAATRGDRRLVAHLAADEPVANAALVCRRYLEQDPGARPLCRPLTAADADTVPFAEDAGDDPRERDGAPAEHRDGRGRRYRLLGLETGMSIPELRWEHVGVHGERAILSLREVVGALQSYEPVCAITRRELWAHAGSCEVSTTVLRLELARVQESPIVLNRRLREVVLAAIAREELSMSEIAIRCGRVKHDRRGNESGETSWLGRRLGLLPEGGQATPTPWIHSDVLALIARSGLGVSPREVEA